MRTKPIFTCFFSLLSLLIFAQKTPGKLHQGSQPTEEKNRPERFAYWMAGVDVLNASLAFFTERKVFQTSLSTPYNRKLMLVADAGLEKNQYGKLGYSAQASGPFVKVGATYPLLWEAARPDNRFYAGLKIAAAFYRQQYDAVPVKGALGLTSTFSLPSSNQSSYWAEAVLGGRIELSQSRWFLEANVQPRYLVFSTKQEDLAPMIVPGFGRSSGKFNLGFYWGIAYRL